MTNSNFLSHAAAALLATILCGLVYVTVQQSHRSAADDPQLQMARDISDRIKNNQSIERSMSSDTFEISQSLAVFTVLYDINGEPVRANGLLDGKLPRIPKGVFDFAGKNGEDVLTWQPRRGVRMAMVVKSVESVQLKDIAFVAVGRSLHEVEKRIANLITMVLIGWLACMAILIIHLLVMRHALGGIEKSRLV